MYYTRQYIVQQGRKPCLWILLLSQFVGPHMWLSLRIEHVAHLVLKNTNMYITYLHLLKKKKTLSWMQGKSRLQFESRLDW